MKVASSKIEALFKDVFFKSHQTVLCGGFTEPEYIPSQNPSELHPHRIHYRSDYTASALHETAHWCIAGSKRRLIKDYGYFYDPGMRTLESQKRFLQAEVLPQTIEALFHEALGLEFEPSLDAFHFSHKERSEMEVEFLESIKIAKKHSNQNLPPRAKQFIELLLVQT